MGRVSDTFDEKCDLADESFFSERVINVWNSLTPTVNFIGLSLAAFKRCLKKVDLGADLTCDFLSLSILP